MERVGERKLYFVQVLLPFGGTVAGSGCLTNWLPEADVRRIVVVVLPEVREILLLITCSFFLLASTPSTGWGGWVQSAFGGLKPVSSLFGRVFFSFFHPRNGESWASIPQHRRCEAKDEPTTPRMDVILRGGG